MIWNRSKTHFLPLYYIFPHFISVLAQTGLTAYEFVFLLSEELLAFFFLCDPYDSRQETRREGMSEEKNREWEQRMKSLKVMAEKKRMKDKRKEVEKQEETWLDGLYFFQKEWITFDWTFLHPSSNLSSTSYTESETDRSEIREEKEIVWLFFFDLDFINERMKVDELENGTISTNETRRRKSEGKKLNLITFQNEKLLLAPVPPFEEVSFYFWIPALIFELNEYWKG